VDELTPLQQTQLVAAGKRYDGGNYSAAERLSFEGSDAHPGGQKQSFKGFLEIREIVDTSGQPAYDAFLYMVDSGTIFRAGTTEEVADVIQCGLECDDEALEEALEPVVADRPVMEKREGADTVETTAKKPATRKVAVKEAAAKKVAVKKPATKNTAAKKATAKKPATKRVAAKKTVTR
jgi:hypothetical protein